MKRLCLIIALTIFSIVASAMETKGILELDVSRTESATVGETYPAILTLVPFEMQLISKETFENKMFLDYFYVARVLQIQQSNNNADAVVVYLDVVLTKKFENQDFKIWPLGARNIPVSFSAGEITDTQLIIKDFITFDTSLKEEFGFGLKQIAFGIVIILLGAVLYLLLRKSGVDKGSEIDVAQELRISNAHKDFEWLYRNRKVLGACMKDRPEAKKKFDELTSIIERYQFRKNWEKMDISELKSRKNKVLETLESGV